VRWSIDRIQSHIFPLGRNAKTPTKIPAARSRPRPSMKRLPVKRPTPISVAVRRYGEAASSSFSRFSEPVAFRQKSNQFSGSSCSFFGFKRKPPTIFTNQKA